MLCKLYSLTIVYLTVIKMMLLAMVMLITSINSLSVMHRILNNLILLQIVEHLCVSNVYPIADNLHKERIKLTLRRLQSLQEYIFLPAFYVHCLSTSSKKEVSVFIYISFYYKRRFNFVSKMLFDLNKILANEQCFYRES